MVTLPSQKTFFGASRGDMGNGVRHCTADGTLPGRPQKEGPIACLKVATKSLHKPGRKYLCEPVLCPKLLFLCLFFHVDFWGPLLLSLKTKAGRSLLSGRVEQVGFLIPRGTVPY